MLTHDTIGALIIILLVVWSFGALLTLNHYVNR